MYLGIRVVLAKTIERIHKANLINFCIVPVEFADENNYDKISQGDELVIDNLLNAVKNSNEVKIENKSKGFEFIGKLNLSVRDREILLSGGLLAYTKKRSSD
jgi:aconitate hydratase